MDLKRIKSEAVYKSFSNASRLGYFILICAFKIFIAMDQMY